MVTKRRDRDRDRLQSCNLITSSAAEGARVSADEEDDPPPSPADELREMREFLQQSRAALWPYAVIGVVVTAAGVAVEVWGAGCSWWAWLVLAVVAWHGFAGDLINVLYLRRRIAAAERPDAEPGAAADRGRR
jgi:hypothetical protein